MAHPSRDQLTAVKQILEVAGGLLVLQAIVGLVHLWIGWFRWIAIVRYLDLATATEVMLSLGFAVVGGVLAVLADRVNAPG